MPSSPDVLVVGAGSFGAWTAWHLRRDGRSVTLIDAFGAGHSRASSGGESRIIRRGYGDRARYSRWAHASLPQWKDLLGAAGRTDLFRETGVLWLGHDGDPHVEGTARILAALGVATEPLTGTELGARFPQLDLRNVNYGVLEPHSGVLLARRAVRAVVDEAKRNGVDYRRAAVAPGGITRHAGAAEVRLADGTRLAAGTLVFACGPWLPRLFPELLAPLIRTTRQEVFFFGTPAGDVRFAPPALPAWIDFPAGAYGLPDIEGRGVKVALTALGPTFDPDRGDRAPSPEGIAAARRIVTSRLPALANAPLVEARVCQYANTPSGDLLIDQHPEHADVWLAGAGSGHGFKLGPAVGAYVAARLAGRGAVEPQVALAAHRAGAERSVL